MEDGKSFDKGFIDSRIRGVEAGFKCSRCGAQGTVMTFPLVNFDDNPQYYAKVRDLDVFKVKCQRCGTETMISYDSLYVSTKNNFFIYLLTDRSLTEKFYNQITYFVETTLNREQRYDVEKFNTRLVHTVNDLLQKFTVFELGLDDRVIEITKYGLFQKGIVDRGKYDAVLFDGMQQTNLIFYAFDSSSPERNTRVAIDFQFYNNVIDMVRRIRPNRGETFQRIDQEWVAKRISMQRESDDREKTSGEPGKGEV